MPGGRPVEYDPLYCKSIVELMSQGMSIYEVAANLNVCQKTIYNWCENYPEFLRAKKEGEEKSRAWWEMNGRVNLNNKDFNSTLWYMNMKNRHKWADKHEVKTDQVININFGEDDD